MIFKFNHFLNAEKSDLLAVATERAKRYSLVRNDDIILADASEDMHGIGKSIEIINPKNKKIISRLHTFLFCAIC